MRDAHDLVSIEAEQFHLGLDLVGDLQGQISAHLRLVAYIGESPDQDFLGDSFNSSCEGSVTVLKKRVILIAVKINKLTFHLFGSSPYEKTI